MRIEDYLEYKHGRERFIKKYLTPAVYGGKVLLDYFVDKDGEIWSSKRNKLCILKGYVNEDNRYPRVTLCIDGVYLKVLIHRVVCETFFKKPLPAGVTEKQWKKTLKVIRDHFDHYWEVNHIDHNTKNYHPSNLEWVSCKENIDRYKVFRDSKKQLYSLAETV